MTVLVAFFGFFALMSVVALVKHHGNPLFLFSLLISVASLVWLLNLERDRGAPVSRRRGRRRPRR